MTIIDKMLDVELHELGYKEGENNWTKYGQWYADNIAHDKAFANAPWCAMFQTWSAAQAGISGEYWPMTSPAGSSCPSMAAWFEEKGFRTGADDMPELGDVVFYSWNGNEDELDHVGMVCAVTGRDPDNALLKVIEGNYADKVGIRNIYYRDWRLVKSFRLPIAKDRMFPELSFLLKRGESGYAVELLQAGLIYRGYDVYGGVDGYFGYNTETALIRYQQDNDLIADGTAGTETFGHLMGCEA